MQGCWGHGPWQLHSDHVDEAAELIHGNKLGATGEAATSSAIFT